jgi:hypothetical protein
MERRKGIGKDVVREGLRRRFVASWLCFWIRRETGGINVNKEAKRKDIFEVL